MGSFAASLRTLGDRRGLPATIHLNEGRLSIVLGDESLGEWGLDEIRLEPTPTGYRMAAEGDQILIEMKDTAAFQSALSKNGTKSRKRSAGKPAKPKTERPRALPAREKVLAKIDKGIAAAEKKWGSLLPEWVFTRIMFGVVFGSLLLTIVLPGLVSTFLLISGVLVVMFGAVVYSDPMLASRWLPGRMAPMHVLIFGVAFLMFGVLLGVLAN